jgi:integrase
MEREIRVTWLGTHGLRGSPYGIDPAGAVPDHDFQARGIAVLVRALHAARREADQARARYRSSERCREKAVEAYWEAKVRVAAGLTAKKRMFADAAEEFIRRKEPNDNRVGVIRRYFIAFFGAAALDAIDDAAYARYQEWRETYWTEGPGRNIDIIEYVRGNKLIKRPAQHKRPSISRLKNEGVTLRDIFKFARAKGYINRLPEMSMPRTKDNRRDGFTMAQYKTLENLAVERMTAPNISPHIRRDRAVLWAYIVLMAFSGLRVTEGKNLDWGGMLLWKPNDPNTPIGERDVEFCVKGSRRGKNRERQFAPQRTIVPALDTLWDVVVRERGTVRPSDPVFADGKGKRIQTFMKGIETLLEKCGLLYDEKGMKRGPGSFRHFYGTQQKMAGVDVYALAKVMGTSVTMIERFYGHIQARDVKHLVRPAWLAA